WAGGAVVAAGAAAGAAGLLSAGLAASAGLAGALVAAGAGPWAPQAASSEAAPNVPSSPAAPRSSARPLIVQDMLFAPSHRPRCRPLRTLIHRRPVIRPPRTHRCRVDGRVAQGNRSNHARLIAPIWRVLYLSKRPSDLVPYWEAAG